ncbi:TetR/AcrR family transcriptional regulator [Streptomonospora nanhaiensis]|uniref:AcrR family transcriptional regulator n=1 Tax=Streptomonospora nanhaiensis TaxID=1323731 RepID=A0A853BU57_9ACTN|nr:TetR/AcrR family transcriptional regulator [Streptomonospora nanhaiensis]MBV2363510.1 TetR/AcrR family transcriptional regulator; helix-turn-helix transcriptional regulator [Streptomonospora nanhaiensis]MBX9390285.1 TetR/AcrR family transcriptional regulator; helix-turn-helix transcriptional regulator [Streptomonospora nanhaiensis]NYI98520.1 AcrR family transcriptional regulator [Streptomonospora nanhaiensis]
MAPGTPSGRPPGRPPGRPRSSVDAEVFAATLRTVHELGYTRATVDRIAAAAGVAKTTIYRRWPSKGELITACLIDTFGPLPLTGRDRDEDLAAAIRWGVAKIGEPGVAAAFAGVFTDAVSDPALREVLTTRLQDPYRIALQEALGESEQRVLFVVDVVVGTLLHRMGITGEPMVESDVELMIDMLRHALRT